MSFLFVAAWFGSAHAQTAPQQPSSADQPRTEQQQEPAVMVAGKFTGVNETEGIKLVAETSDFKHLFQIAALANKEVKDLRVEVAPFTGPNSVQSNIVWKVNNEAGDKPVTVPGLTSIPLELNANLPIAGAYDSTIWLIYDARRWPIKLTVTRTRTAPSVDVLGIEVARDTAFRTSENASLWFTLHEKAGKQVTLNMPTLTSLALVQSDKNKLQAKYDSIEVKCVGQDCKQQQDGSLVLGPGKTIRLQLTVVGLRDSGEFSGNLRVSGSEGDPIDTAVTFLRKKSAWLAGLLIALGVAISFALRHYASAVRPRLILQREALALKEDIDGLKREFSALNTDEMEALARLDNQARDLGDDIAMARANNADQAIKDIKSKVEIFPLWIQERIRVDALKPSELQNEFRVELDKIKTFMNTQPITDELVKEARATLDKIRPQIKVKVKEDLTNKVTAFKSELNSHRNSSSPQIRTRLSQEVEPEIDKVEELLKSDENLDEARAAYNCARVAYIRILCDELKSSLPEDLPLGFEAAEWKELRGDVLNHLSASGKATDADEAMKIYLNAYLAYIRGLTWKLQERLTSKQELIEKSASINESNKAKYKILLAGVGTSLTAALAKVDSGDMQGAAQDYEAARTVFVQVDTELQTIGGALAAAPADAAELAAAATPGTVPGPFSLPFLGVFTSRSRTRTVRELTRKLGLLDLIFTVIVLLIAIFLGVQLLWVGNATWGGWDAYLSAVLWGLGLHQVSGVAFEGLQGLAAKFGAGNTSATT